MKNIHMNTMDDSQDLVLSERKQTQKVYSLLFYLYEVKEQAKLMECDRSATNSHLLGRGIDWAEERASVRC